MEFGVRTRARTLATATATAGESSTSKKRKAVDLGDSTPTHTHTHTHIAPPPRRRRRRQLRFDTTDEVRSSTETLNCSTQKVDSRCSSNGSSELVEESLVIGSGADLHSESLPYESSTCLNCSKRGDITPSSSFREKSDDQEPMESSVSRSSRSRPKDEKITSPLQAEIDGFFTTAEKEEQKRFADKYNYDIAKDIPLEGRYEWVRVNDDKLVDDRKV